MNMLPNTFWNPSYYYRYFVPSAPSNDEVQKRHQNNIRTRVTSRNYLKTIYHHPRIKCPQNAESSDVINDFWFNIKAFTRDPDELLLVLNLLNNKSLSLSTLNKTLRERQQQISATKPSSRALSDEDSLEELRIIFTEETRQYQPSFPYSCNSNKIIQWEEKLMYNLRLFDSNIWKLSQEKIWVIAEMYCLLTNRNHQIPAVKQQKLDYLCININKTIVNCTTLEEFLEKIHAIFIER